MTNNLNLQARLREGQGADRELDWKIHKLFWPGMRDLIPPVAPAHTPQFTSDLNAVFALVERELPDRCLDLRKGYGYTATVYCVGDDTVSAWKHSDACRALLLALLAATQKE